MKNSFLLFALLLSINLLAQQTEGTIHFTETIHFEVELPAGQEHLKDLIPSSQSHAKVLYFTADKSLYKDIDTDDGATEINQVDENQNVQIKIETGSSDNRLLKDFVKEQTIDQREFLGKKFLIKGALAKMEWKITGEQKELLGFACQKAILADTSQHIIAWFTAQIPASNGPDMFGNLPGMILELENGEQTIIANKVAFGTISSDLLETPKKGKKVTQEEFQKIQEEKLKEIGGDGSGQTVIRMEVRGE